MLKGKEAEAVFGLKTGLLFVVVVVVTFWESYNQSMFFFGLDPARSNRNTWSWSTWLCHTLKKASLDPWYPRTWRMTSSQDLEDGY